MIRVVWKVFALVSVKDVPTGNQSLMKESRGTRSHELGRRNSNSSFHVAPSLLSSPRLSWPFSKPLAFCDIPYPKPPNLPFQHTLKTSTRQKVCKEERSPM
jgi:hypothetical protein